MKINYKNKRIKKIPKNVQFFSKNFLEKIKKLIFKKFRKNIKNFSEIYIKKKVRLFQKNLNNQKKKLQDFIKK